MRRLVLMFAVAAMIGVMLMSAGPATAGVTIYFGETDNQSGTVTFTNIIDIGP